MTAYLDALSLQRRSSPYFTLSVSHTYTKTVITMHVRSEHVSTQYYPKTRSILRTHLPSILRSHCYNDGGLPFHKEVLCTEIGHLFEHILLEHLCSEKLHHGCTKAVYNGVTNWNWVKENWGTFHITVDAGYRDGIVWRDALEKSIALMEYIFTQHTESSAASLSVM